MRDKLIEMLNDKTEFELDHGPNGTGEELTEKELENARIKLQIRSQKRVRVLDNSKGRSRVLSATNEQD